MVTQNEVKRSLHGYHFRLLQQDKGEEKNKNQEKVKSKLKITNLAIHGTEVEELKN